MPSQEAILSCLDVTVRFGGVQALSEVEFRAATGAITSIIGPNCAGKTTLLNAISGMVGLSSGRIEFFGRDVTALPAHRRSRAGMVRTFQNLEIFTNMSVIENAMAGCHARTRYPVLDCLLTTPRARAAERLIREQALEALDFVGLSDYRDMPAKELPFGRQRLLELARALAARPKLLLLDEPAAGLNIRETRALGEIVRRIRAEMDVSVVLVEHDMDLVMGVSDEIMVLCFGQAITRGEPAKVQKDPEVIAAYLGTDGD